MGNISTSKRVTMLTPNLDHAGEKVDRQLVALDESVEKAVVRAVGDPGAEVEIARWPLDCTEDESHGYAKWWAKQCTLIRNKFKYNDEPGALVLRRFKHDGFAKCVVRFDAPVAFPMKEAT